MKCLNMREAAASVESYLSQGMSWVLWKFLLHVIYLSVNRWQYCAKYLFLADAVGHGLSQMDIIV